MLKLLGGLVFTSILISPLAARIRRPPCLLLMVMTLALIAGAGFSPSIWNGSITFWQWAQCELALAAFLLAIAFFVHTLLRMKCDAVAASAIATLLVLAWLTAPVWLSPSLAGNRLHYSIALHPLFVLNGIVPQLGIWTEQQVAYNLTTLGQDVQYDLPASPWLFVFVYGLLAAISWGFHRMIHSSPSLFTSSSPG